MPAQIRNLQWCKPGMKVFIRVVGAAGERLDPATVIRWTKTRVYVVDERGNERSFYQPTWALKLIEWKKLRPGQGFRELVSENYPTFKAEVEAAREAGITE
jgi:hypothetical protein